MIDITQSWNTLQISYFDKTGNVQLIQHKIPKEQLFNWIEVPETSKDKDPLVKSWDNKAVKRAPTKILSTYRLYELLETLPTDIQEKIFEYNTPKKYFIDIETDYGDEFPKPENANYPVTVISIVHENTIITLGTKPLSQLEILQIKQQAIEYLGVPVKFKYAYYETEFNMLMKFFELIKTKGFLTGWNFLNFDWLYLTNRAKKLLLDITEISPTNSFYDNMPKHKIVVDYMELYKKYDRSVEVKESNSLDFVAEAVCGKRKIKYNGTLKALYEQNYNLYVLYNAIDTYLVKMIDAKLNCATTENGLAKMTRTALSRVSSPIFTTERVMLSEFLKRNKVLVSKKTSKRESYEGAFVFPVKPDLYDWVCSFDFASLYPTIMRQWNISPETYMGKVSDVSTIDTTNYIVCDSGAYFSKEPGVFPSFLTEYYSKRKKFKEQYTEYEARSAAGETDPELVVQINYFKSMEQAIKIFINSVYGATASPYFIGFNVNISEAITLQGQAINRFVSEKISSYFFNFWHQDTKLHQHLGITQVVPRVVNPVLIYQDTDSDFFCFQEVVPKSVQNPVEFIKNLYKFRLKEFLNKHLDSYAKKHGCAENLQNLEMETISYSGIFFSKKKYILNIAWKDGKDEGIYYESLKKMKYTGVELVRSDTPKFCRERLKDYVKLFFTTRKSVNYHELILKIKSEKETFKLAPLEDICLTARVGDYEKNIIKDSEQFVIASGCPMHVRGAGYHNFLVNSSSKYKQKYQKIKSGDKVRYYTTKDTTNNVFAFLPNNLPVEFAPQIDYDRHFARVFIDIINRFISVLGLPEIPSNLFIKQALF